MSRLARQLSNTGLYHIVFRGVNRQHIFEESHDYEMLIDILKNLKEELKFEIYVYCLMSNHVHILLKERNMGDISLIMKRLLTKYVRWYNKKYQRSGALIANRYKSQPVEVDEYFLLVVRYIHQNPIKSGIVSDISDYKWSSYNEYIYESTGIVDKNFVLEMIPESEFEEFHKIDNGEIFIVNDKIKITDDEVRRQIIKSYQIEPNQIIGFDRQNRNIMLHKLKEKFSIRQIERVTGISRGIIQKS